MNVLKLVVIAAALLASAASARAQEPPQGEEFPVGLIVVPDQPIEIVRPNVFDPFHPKVLRFHGIVGGGVDPAELTVFFDWLDPAGGPAYSPPTTIPVPPHEFLPLDLEYTIPFCPQLVSLDLRAAGGPIEVTGVFSHQCVPEPNSIAAAGTGLVALGCLAAARRRRSRRNGAASA
ncbi:MAG: hypothetical protein DCC68_08235 [Planctomycetota bacterium]|nr:MAG: hypothetical protein DCC68_08235 [Planctomycetota bacterium]